MEYHTGIRLITIFNREGIKLPDEMKLIIRKAIKKEKETVKARIKYWEDSNQDTESISKGYKTLDRIESYERRVLK